MKYNFVYHRLCAETSGSIKNCCFNRGKLRTIKKLDKGETVQKKAQGYVVLVMLRMVTGRKIE